MNKIDLIHSKIVKYFPATDPSSDYLTALLCTHIGCV